MGKTLKKTLSLVLALVMVFGLCGVATTGAYAETVTRYNATVFVKYGEARIPGVTVTLTGEDGTTYTATTGSYPSNYGRASFNVPAGTYTATTEYVISSFYYTGSKTLTVANNGDNSATISVTGVSRKIVDHIDIGKKDGSTAVAIPNTATVVVYYADGTSVTLKQTGTSGSSGNTNDQWRFTGMRDYSYIADKTDTDSKRVTGFHVEYVYYGNTYAYTVNTYAGLEAGYKACPGTASDDNKGLDVAVLGSNTTAYYFYKVVYNYYTGTTLDATDTSGTVQQVTSSSVTLTPDTSMTYNSNTYALSSASTVYTNVSLTSSTNNSTKFVTITLDYVRSVPTYTYSVQYAYFTNTNSGTYVSDGTGAAAEQSAVSAAPTNEKVLTDAAGTSDYGTPAVTYTRGAAETDVSSTGTLADGSLVYTVNYYRSIYTYDVVYEYYTVTNGTVASTADGSFTKIDNGVIAADPGATAVQSAADANSTYNSVSYAKGAAETDVSSTGTLADGSLVYTVKYYRSVSEWGVTYSWTSATSGKELPSALTAPTDTNKYASEDAATAAMETTYIKGSKYVVDGEGTWAFSGWTKGTAANYTVPFSGTWTFEAAEVTVDTASFTVKKVDAAGAALAGATFTLKNASDESIVPTVNEAKTEFTFSGLTEGTYTLTEKAPDGYKAAGPWTVTVKKETTGGKLVVTIAGDSGNLISNGVLTVTNVKNETAETVDNSLIVIKTGTDSKRLAGAEFTLYSDNDCKKSVAAYTSDADGKLTISTADTAIKALIKEGETVTLYLKETKAPEGYNAVDTVWTVSVASTKAEPVLSKDNTSFVTVTTNTISVPEATGGTLTVENKAQATIVINYFVDDSTYDSARHTGTPVSKTVTLTAEDGKTYNTDNGTHTFDNYTQTRVVGSTTGTLKGGETTYVDYLYKKTVTVTITHVYTHTTNGTNSTEDGKQTTTVASYEGEVIDLSTKLATSYKNNNYNVKGYDPSQKVTVKASGNSYTITYVRNISDNSPKTGDSSALIAILAVLALSAGGFGLVYFRKPKKHED